MYVLYPLNLYEKKTLLKSLGERGSAYFKTPYGQMIREGGKLLMLKITNGKV